MCVHVSMCMSMCALLLTFSFKDVSLEKQANTKLGILHAKQQRIERGQRTSACQLKRL